VLNEASRQHIHEIWDRLSEFGAQHIDEALEYVLRELVALIGAQHGYWLGSVRLSEGDESDPANGWRARAVWYLDSTPEREARYKQLSRRLDNGEANPSIVANVREAGRFRVNIRSEYIPPEWYESEFYKKFYGKSGIQDVAYVATPLAPDAESWFCFERIGSPGIRYDNEARVLLDYAVRPMRWFHRQLLLHRGVLIADEPFTPSERRVLNALLTDKTEQQIAEELGLTPTTVHTYSTRICRKFNVRRRAGLTALWLGQTE